MEEKQIAELRKFISTISDKKVAPFITNRNQLIGYLTRNGITIWWNCALFGKRAEALTQTDRPFKRTSRSIATWNRLRTP